MCLGEFKNRGSIHKSGWELAKKWHRTEESKKGTEISQKDT